MLRQLVRSFARQHRDLALGRSHSTLVLGEALHGDLTLASKASLAAAKALGHPVTLLLAGTESDQLIQSTNGHSSGASMLLAEDNCLAHNLPEPHAALLAAVQRKRLFSHILAPNSTHGKNVLPRAAALLDAQPVSDVIQIVDDRTFVRPTHAGNVLETVQFTGSTVRMLTVRTSAFDSPASAEGSSSETDRVSDEELAAAREASGKSQWVAETQPEGERPELGAARVVVAGGRALKSADGFTMIQDLADLLGGAVGASRAAVDAGYAGNDLQVGQTGKIVAPDLYIAVGISGAIQHLAGMKDSRCIVAINSDPEAPIFQVADYGLVGDLFEILPELQQQLKAAVAAK